MAYRARSRSRTRPSARRSVSRRTTSRTYKRRPTARKRSTGRRSPGRELRIVVQAAPEATAMATAGSIRVAAKKSGSIF